MTFQHESVLLNESLEYMMPEPGETFVDGTLGGAGHSLAFLSKLMPHGLLIGIDQDQEALDYAEERLSAYKENIILVHNNFSNIKEILEELNIESVDGIFLDIGVSSHQIDKAERGFSYIHDADLDMRMDRSQKLTAEIVVNKYSFEDLHMIIRKYGEENWAKRIAEFIVEKRKLEPIKTTGQLVKLIEAAIPVGAREKNSHPAKRTFQAIRIEVNKELEVLEKTIDDSFAFLKAGGRLGIISFHSLEDRIIKEKFNYFAKECICPPQMPICVCDKKKEGVLVNRKPIIASVEEREKNPRSRSAKLRLIKKI